MFSTTQKLPLIALAGTISFMTTLTAFTVMTSPARAEAAAGLPAPQILEEGAYASAKRAGTR